jgi:hypothetical protein
VIVTYTPEDGEPRRWDLDDVKLLTSEAEAIERVTGLGWAHVRSPQTLVFKDSPTAKRALVWVLLKRDEPALRYRDFDPVEDAITVRLGLAEARQVRAEIDREYGDDEDRFDRAMREVDGMTDPKALASEAEALGVAAAALAGEGGPKDQPSPPRTAPEPQPEESPSAG